jgi:hypothetical protein
MQPTKMSERNRPAKQKIREYLAAAGLDEAKAEEAAALFFRWIHDEEVCYCGRSLFASSQKEAVYKQKEKALKRKMDKMRETGELG